MTQCYSTGAVIGRIVMSAGWWLSGRHCFRSVWDVDLRPIGKLRGVGLTTAEMMDPDMLGLNGLRRDPNWVLDAGRDYPRLAWEGTPGQNHPGTCD